jgi:uncharacterized protein YaaR (DUF327 family)
MFCPLKQSLFNIDNILVDNYAQKIAPTTLLSQKHQLELLERIPEIRGHYVWGLL